VCFSRQSGHEVAELWIVPCCSLEEGGLCDNRLPHGPAGPASTLNQKSFSRRLRRKKHFECFAALAENLLNAAGW
jgi:hypothetical protein